MFTSINGRDAVVGVAAESTPTGSVTAKASMSLSGKRSREFVSRALANLRLLRSRLRDLCYRFASPGTALLESDADTSAACRPFSEWGELPLLLEAWYEQICAVDFRQAREQLKMRDGAAEAEPVAVAGLGLNTSLVFLPVEQARAMAIELDEDADGESDMSVDEHMGSGESEDHFPPLGGWASNNEPKGFWLPSRTVDDIYYYNDGGGDTLFATNSAWHSNGEVCRCGARWLAGKGERLAPGGVRTSTAC